MEEAVVQHEEQYDLPTRNRRRIGRLAVPAEWASIYVQLAAKDASFATGQVYGAAGGSGQP